LPGFHGLAIRARAFDDEPEIREIPNGFFNAGENPWFIRNNLRDGIFSAGGKRKARDVLGIAIGVQKFFSEGANHFEIFGIRERERISAK
jgi:hypothetical protein